MRGTGLVLSRLDGSERVYGLPDGYKPLRSYSYRDFMYSVHDQGSRNSCVAESIGAVIEWFWKTARRPAVFDVDALYSRRTTEGDLGMSFKEALASMVKDGYSHSGVVEHLYDYVMLRSRTLMEAFLVTDGPFIMGLPVFDSSKEDFWHGSALEGYHAVVCSGFTPSGMEILNSWGSSYGDHGYSEVSWDDVGLIQEAWGLKF